MRNVLLYASWMAVLKVLVITSVHNFGIGIARSRVCDSVRAARRYLGLSVRKRFIGCFCFWQLAVMARRFSVSVCIAFRSFFCDVVGNVYVLLSVIDPKFYDSMLLSVRMWYVTFSSVIWFIECFSNWYGARYTYSLNWWFALTILMLVGRDVAMAGVRRAVYAASANIGVAPVALSSARRESPRFRCSVKAGHYNVCRIGSMFVRLS